jgi:ABC-type nickel/cobalt efflux system permease component RcnA
MNNPPTKLYAWLEIIGAILLLIVVGLAWMCWKQAMRTKRMIEAQRNDFGHSEIEGPNGKVQNDSNLLDE